MEGLRAGEMHGQGGQVLVRKRPARGSCEARTEGEGEAGVGEGGAGTLTLPPFPKAPWPQSLPEDKLLWLGGRGWWLEGKRPLAPPGPPSLFALRPGAHPEVGTPSTPLRRHSGAAGSMHSGLWKGGWVRSRAHGVSRSSRWQMAGGQRPSLRPPAGPQSRSWDSGAASGEAPQPLTRSSYSM